MIAPRSGQEGDEGKEHVQMSRGIGMHDMARELWDEVRPKLGQRA